MFLNHHNHHNHHREDIFTISNPMEYPRTFSYTGAVCSKSTTMDTEPAEISHETWLQLNDSPVSTNARSTHLDHQEARRKRKHSYVKYIINSLLIIMVSLFCLLVELGYMPHIQQSFVCKDPKLSHRYQKDTISVTSLVLINLLLPLTSFLTVEYLRAPNEWKVILPFIGRWSKYLILGNLITLFMVEVLKVVFGEMRPHFFDTCAPDTAATCHEGDVISNYVCTNPNSSFMLKMDSARSFPSGHAALAVFTSLYCAAYIYYRFHMPSMGSVLKLLLIGTLMTWGLACGLTRIFDQRHHWWDVLAGTVLGCVTALFTILCVVTKFTNKTKPSNSVSSTTLWNGKTEKEDVGV